MLGKLNDKNSSKRLFILMQLKVSYSMTVMYFHSLSLIPYPHPSPLFYPSIFKNVSSPSSFEGKEEIEYYEIFTAHHNVGHILHIL